MIDIGHSRFAIKYKERNLFFFVVGVFLCFAIQSVLTIVIGALLLILFNLIYCKIGFKDFFWAFLIFLACAPAIIAINHGFSPLFYSILFCLSLITAKTIAECDISEIQSVFRRVYIFFAVVIFIAYWSNRSSPEPFEGLIPGTSQNGITSYLVVLQVTLSIFSYLRFRVFPLGSSVCTLVIAIIGYGRGSIYAASLVVFLSALFNLINYIRFLELKKMLISLSLIAFIFGLVATNVDAVLGFLESGTKALEGPKDSARLEILEEYISNLNWLNFLTGQAFEGTLIGDRYEGNPHIAYLRTHAYMGVLVIPILLSPLLVFFLKWRLVDKIFIFSFMLIFQFRALSEPILFPTLLDFCYFLPFFYLAHTRPISRFG